MSLGFAFGATVNPNKPLDPNDPPPEGWDNGIDTHDYRKALFGHPSRLFTECHEWEEREKKRVTERLHPNAAHWVT